MQITSRSVLLALAALASLGNAVQLVEVRVEAETHAELRNAQSAAAMRSLEAFEREAARRYEQRVPDRLFFDDMREALTGIWSGPEAYCRDYPWSGSPCRGLGFGRTPRVLAHAGHLDYG